MRKEIEFLKKQNQELQNQLNHQSNNSITKTEENKMALTLNLDRV